MLSALQGAGKGIRSSLIEMIRAEQSNTKVVVWQNEFWGVPVFDGKPLDKMPELTWAIQK